MGCKRIGFLTNFNETKIKRIFNDLSIYGNMQKYNIIYFHFKPISLMAQFLELNRTNAVRTAQ